MARLAVLASLTITVSCSTDGREMSPPKPNQVQTIIDETTVATASLDDSGAFDSLESIAPTFSVAVPWTEAGPIPADHTCSGDGVSPSITWSGAPAETRSFAVVVTDLDAFGPTGEPLVHWVVANIDASSDGLASGGAIPGVIEATNDLGRPDVPIVGWSAPCPPLGETHTYLVTVHALAQTLDLVDGTPAADLVRAIELASLTSTSVTGTVTSG